jgi:hypothetical protein
MERLVWTVVAAALTNLSTVGLLDIAAWKGAALAALNGAATFLLLVARSRLAVLPDPGAGLPGLRVATVDVEERLRGAGIWDDEPTTPSI